MFGFIRNFVESYRIYFKEYGWGFAKLIAFAIVFHVLYDFFKDLKEIFISVYILLFAQTVNFHYIKIHKSHDKRNK
jgi:hypothetical protein